MIEFKKVKKYYERTIGLYEVDMQIKKGEVVGILGENGSGKSTMLKVMMGLTEVTFGEVSIEEKKPSELYERMAFITEEGSYFPNMTIGEYGEFLSVFYPKFDHERYRKLTDYFALSKLKKIKTFSKGEKSKVEIAAGFAKMADYILMDEPFLGKDMFTRKDFLKLMVSSLKEEETILISTHQLSEIENFIDRAVVLRDGTIKADFYLDDIREEGKSLPEKMMEILGYDENRYKRVFENQ
ncbi:ABC-2 type transport system ATP-binding protein [Natranaerovirga pectinivora]|uniref:ABC-2 type transport system ATP-binding protein n=1 Tax=Natranaerovirga pectinivora TaxID=682400 RepID=A0A4R3MMA5_9FIRM|nr:ABC transporter ATP-binding protein [Natranaerovirga pectinivora]TCT13116.1 ABC-2 type transport system ATP-binding protein [Natranaerovirga pectinivora]